MRIWLLLLFTLLLVASLAYADKVCPVCGQVFGDDYNFCDTCMVDGKAVKLKSASVKTKTSGETKKIERIYPFAEDTWISLNSYHKEQKGYNSAFNLDVPEDAATITLHYMLRNGWYKPTGFKIVTNKGEEIFSDENSVDKYETTKTIKIPEGVSNLSLKVTNADGDYTIFFADSYFTINTDP